MEHFDMCCIYIVCVFFGRSPTAQCIAFGKQREGTITSTKPFLLISEFGPMRSEPVPTPYP